VKKPADMVGKKVGIQATGMVLLRALLAQNKIAEKDVNVIPIGGDMTPLMSGQVDVVTGWLTNTTALKVLGKERVDLSLWDSGVRLYALPYYATTKTLQSQPKVLEAFLRATARGWSYAARESRCGRRPADQGVSEPESRRRAGRARRDAALQLQRSDQDAGLGRHGPGRLAGADLAVRATRPVHRQDAQARRRDDARRAEGDDRGAAEGLTPWSPH
jgi:ABC-type nitrate/sulfonate/bicarbonate transport system substrate-binding protein